MGLSRLGKDELGTDAIEIASEVEVLAIVALAPFSKAACHELLAHAVGRPFEGNAHKAQAVWVALGIQQGDHAEHQICQKRTHFAAKLQFFRKFAAKKERL